MQSFKVYNLWSFQVSDQVCSFTNISVRELEQNTEDAQIFPPCSKLMQSWLFSCRKSYGQGISGNQKTCGRGSRRWDWSPSVRTLMIDCWLSIQSRYLPLTNLSHDNTGSCLQNTATCSDLWECRWGSLHDLRTSHQNMQSFICQKECTLFYDTCGAYAKVCAEAMQSLCLFVIGHCLSEISRKFIGI